VAQISSHFDGYLHKPFSAAALASIGTLTPEARDIEEELFNVTFDSFTQLLDVFGFAL